MNKPVFQPVKCGMDSAAQCAVYASGLCGRISVRQALALTGWDRAHFYKMLDAGLIHRCEPKPPGTWPRYWRAEIMWLITPPHIRGRNPVTGKL
jgi:hypothetical protein